MKRTLTRMTEVSLACLPLLLAGCGSVSLPKIWPFSDAPTPARARVPVNATPYQCEGGKRFHVRALDGGAVWLILPEREVRLDPLGSDGVKRYSNGIAVLDISGNEATLKDGTTSFTGCKTATSP